MLHQNPGYMYVMEQNKQQNNESHNQGNIAAARQTAVHPYSLGIGGGGGGGTPNAAAMQNYYSMCASRAMAGNEDVDRMYPVMDPYYTWAHTYGHPSPVTNSPTSSSEDTSSRKSNSVEKESPPSSPMKEKLKAKKGLDAEVLKSAVNANKIGKEQILKEKKAGVYQSFYPGQNNVLAANPGLVPVFMLPPHQYASHPGAFNAAIAAHVAAQGNVPPPNTPAAIHPYGQMPTYGHYSANAAAAAANAAAAAAAYGMNGYNSFYGATASAVPEPNRRVANPNYMQSPNSYGSDYNSVTTSSQHGTSSSNGVSSDRASRSNDGSQSYKTSSNQINLSKNRNNYDYTYNPLKVGSNDKTRAGYHNERDNRGHIKNGSELVRSTDVNGNLTDKSKHQRKYQATAQIKHLTLKQPVGVINHVNGQTQIVLKQKQKVGKQSSYRSHSYGSDLSAGCSARNCMINGNLEHVHSSRESSQDSGLSHLKSNTTGESINQQGSTTASSSLSQNLQSNDSHVCASKSCECMQHLTNPRIYTNSNKNRTHLTSSSENSSGIQIIKKPLSPCCSTGSDCDQKDEKIQMIESKMRKFSNNPDFKRPDSELIKKLIDLIEFYLSDEYLAKDKYLLRQIRCKSEGYISIKLMTSFKKVKKLTRDWRGVRYALMQTDKLVVSPEGFRVKRADTLPESLRKPRLLSSVISIRLGSAFTSVDAITQLFSKYGEIGLVRILKPGKEIPSDLRNYATQVPDIGKTWCAVVDYEQSEAALQAVRCLKDYLMDNGMRLALLGPRVRRTLYKQDKPGEDDDVAASVISESTIDQAADAFGKFAHHDNDLDDIIAETTPLEKSDGDTEISEPIRETHRSVIKTHLKYSSHRESVESATSTKACDESVDSGNCESTGTASNDEDIKVSISEDNTKVKQSKMSIILREPGGPGSNPEKTGFSFKRHLI